MAGSFTVDATLNYLVPMQVKPRILAYQPPPGVPRSNAAYEARTVQIHDLRASAYATSLDREGFELIGQRSAVRNFYDEDELRRVYYPEAERLVAAVTGGSRVLVFDHTVRRHVRGMDDRVKGAPRQPLSYVHNDYTIDSGPRRLHDLRQHEGGLPRNRRFSIINLWRPIRGPVCDAPLAVCDAHGVAPGDFVAADLVYPGRTGEHYLVTYSAAHRWSYVSDMVPDEALLFRCYDSATDGRARFTPHAAFTDPAAAPDSPPRESIELRTIAFYAA